MRIKPSTYAYWKACWESIQPGVKLIPLFPEHMGQAKGPRVVIYKDPTFSRKTRVMVTGEDGLLTGKHMIGVRKLRQYYTWEGKPQKPAASRLASGVRLHSGGKLTQRIAAVSERVSSLEEQVRQLTDLLTSGRA